MIIKGLVDEDFVQSKYDSMFVIMPYCTFKCDKENGCALCQNSALATQPSIELPNKDLIQRYITNPVTNSICFGGLEPFDSAELQQFIMEFRASTDDLIIIYTGYTEEEVQDKYSWIYSVKNVIIKFGRFRPNQQPHRDEVLGINLISDNQYAKRIS